jgi:hypothetical protein
MLYSGKVTKAHLLTPGGSAVVMKKIGRGDNFTPAHGHWKVRSCNGIKGRNFGSHTIFTDYTL